MKKSFNKHLGSLLISKLTIAQCFLHFQFITKMLLVLLDWVMVIPRDVLLQRRGSHEESQTTYLGLVMRVSNMISFMKIEHIEIPFSVKHSGSI